MFCRNCGKEIDDNAYVCPHCGAKTDKDDVSKVDADNGSKVGWGFLCFFVPVVGLVLFLVWRQDRPNTAKVCGICALVSVIIEAVVGTIVGIIYGIALGSFFGGLYGNLFNAIAPII